jgi:hypothetical protein
MAFSSAWRESFRAGYDHGRQSGNARPQRIFGGAALALVALACAWILCANLSGTGVDQVVEVRPRPQTPPTASSAYARLAAALNAYARRSVAANGEVALFAARFSLGSSAGTFFKSAALQPDGQPGAPALRESIMQKAQAADAVPLQGDREARGAEAPAQQLRLPSIRTASVRDNTPATRAAASATGETPSIFEKLFGKPSPLTLAYASPDDGGLDDERVTLGRYDRWTAVYDISAHMVYMPDGTRLEAHSGYGSRMDDPRHTDERMRGATPPNVYDLELREGLFHGVQALRLIPVDEEKVFGRTGLLAHTFMLGSNGQSNGCVSFRNYDAFLHAYLNHQIKRLVVVSHLDRV